MKMTVHSLRVENVAYCYGSSDTEEEGVINILNCIGDNGYRYELRISETVDDCPSGYTIAIYGNAVLVRVDSFIGMTHKPKKELSFDVDDKYVQTIEGVYGNYAMSFPDMTNDIFTIEYELENADWYPSATCDVNMELFTPTKRAKEKRPVWIFKGDSGLGKSYLAAIIRESGREKVVYETDSDENLDPEGVGFADIIVIGNKYNHQLSDVTKLIRGCYELIFVDFTSMN